MSSLVFFFKQKTAYEMRISDWSSDVCSSDLDPRLPLCRGPRGQARLRRGLSLVRPRLPRRRSERSRQHGHRLGAAAAPRPGGRPGERPRVRRPGPRRGAGGSGARTATPCPIITTAPPALLPPTPPPPPHHPHPPTP